MSSLSIPSTHTRTTTPGTWQLKVNDMYIHTHTQLNEAIKVIFLKMIQLTKRQVCQTIHQDQKGFAAWMASLIGVPESKQTNTLETQSP